MDAAAHPMVDIHAHILPGVDDGPSDLEEAVRMAEVARADGVTRIVATPHIPFCRLGCQELQQRLEALQTELCQRGIDVEVSLGAEISLQPEVVQWLASGRACPLGSTRYVLIELPFVGLPIYADDTIFYLQVEGYHPILAHAERNDVLARSPARLKSLVERGVLAQVTSGSFLGQFGSGIQRAAEQFLEQGLVHVLATDAHSAVGRPPTLSEGVRQAERIVGDRAWEMATIIPSAILSDTLLEVEPPRAKKKAHRFW